MPSGAAHRTVQADQLCPTCPYFLPTPTDVTTPVGIPANLTCGVRQLGDKKVTCLRGTWLVHGPSLPGQEREGSWEKRKDERKERRKEGREKEGNEEGTEFG
ncbi:hypothetical protein O3P69_011414 [Scylla paramamosain]|uniref:Uncharacterized protein n=1 Tax=Scylla paramamosain TaxID=85552 RepID=A0AAW0T6J7_SCYPA